MTALPPRVRLSRAKGADYRRDHPGAVNVARPSNRNAWRHYGNPFEVAHAFADDPTLTVDQARERCARYYARWLAGDPEFTHVRPDRRTWILDHLEQLACRPLACWCPLPEPGHADHCHAAVLLARANKPTR